MSLYSPSLTWRDVQHLAVRTAQSGHLSHVKGWKTNRAGLRYHSHVGFGLMNAKKMVLTAKRLKTLVGPQIVENYKPNENLNIKIDVGSNFNKPFEVTVDVSGSKIKHLEHVEMVSTLKPEYRGCLHLTLISPSITKSKVLGMREHDSSSRGFLNWKFMSVNFWGENPEGKWRFQIRHVILLFGNTLRMYNFHLCLRLSGVRKRVQRGLHW